MKGHCNALRCNYCGRFISFSKPRWNYTPFDANALEPPDDVNICEKCYNRLSEKDLALIKSIAWIPLTKIEVK
jgi:hypothetical protein